MLIAQGERDYQVLASALATWERGLAGRSDVTVKRYAAANHLFIDGTGPPQPAEYGTPGHVSAAVIADIASWIKTH